MMLNINNTTWGGSLCKKDLRSALKRGIIIPTPRRNSLGTRFYLLIWQKSIRTFFSIHPLGPSTPRRRITSSIERVVFGSEGYLIHSYLDNPNQVFLLKESLRQAEEDARRERNERRASK